MGRKRPAAAGKEAATTSAAAARKKGEWRASNIAGKTFKMLQKEGQIPQSPGSWRKPGTEEVPCPMKNERVVFADHFPRGFSFPLHPFFRALLYVYGIQIHDLPPNAIQHITCFIVLCECFLGIHPHWALWKRIFSVKLHTEAASEGEKHGPPCTTGAFGIQVTKNVSYFDMKFVASVQNWRRRWFYLKGTASDGIPPFNPHAVLSRRKSWNHQLSAEELQLTEPLVEQIAALRNTSSGHWVNGIHLSCVFVQRRIQPLQDRAHPMWEYSGKQDVTRTKADELSHDEFDTRIRAITHINGEETPVLAAIPLSSENPPTKVITRNFHSELIRSILIQTS